MTATKTINPCEARRARAKCRLNNSPRRGGCRSPLNVNCRPRIIRKVNPLDQIGRTGSEKKDKEKERGAQRERRFIFIAAASCCRKLPKRNPPLFLRPSHPIILPPGLFQTAAASGFEMLLLGRARNALSTRSSHFWPRYFVGRRFVLWELHGRPCGRKLAELEIGSIARLWGKFLARGQIKMLNRFFPGSYSSLGPAL